MTIQSGPAVDNESSVHKEFDKAYSWLKISKENHLSVAVQTLVKQLNLKLEQQKYVECWALIDKLEEVVKDPIDDLDKAEALVECGRAAFYMGNLERAIQLLDGAFQGYRTQYHHLAAIKWMAGVILWQIPARHNEAIKVWEFSRKHFELLINQSFARREESAWYRKQCEEMSQIISDWVSRDGPPTAQSEPQSAPQRPGPQPGAPTGQQTTPPPKPAAPTPEVSYTPNYLELYAISASIPAGGFGPMGYDPNPIGYILIERVYINDKPYRIVNLGQGGNILHLNSRATYDVLKVKGDSMDKATPEPITEDDFVLLKLQADGDPNDIVAAEVVGKEREATLKRLRGRGKNRRLEAESSNPIYNNDERFRGRFEIRGVAVAIFKPIH